jgi:single-stranded-DNA-specific exonuclease
MYKTWEIAKHKRELVENFARELNVHPLTAALLILRGYDTKEKAYEFLYPTLNSLHSPFLLKNMEKAVSRIIEAIEKKEKILVWGDYDVDGVTGTALLRKALRSLSVEADYYIPHRIHEGYGLNIEALKRKKEEGIKLVITVDTGSLAFEAARWALENDLCLIITDHHIVSSDEKEIKAYALINPHQKECPYPNKKIAGVGLAFKLSQALLEKLIDNKNELSVLLEDLLELVAIGTVADVMELSGENRSIVKFGLKRLKETKNKGLKALIEAAGLKDRKDLSTYNVGFQIAPRINAAGRLEHASIIVELLETDSEERALEIAKLLNETNKTRQNLQNQMIEEAFKSIDKSKIPFAVVLGNKGWHRGIVGLVASKITEAFYRPSFIISIEDDVGYGSARSIEEFDVTEALKNASEILINYGGHKQAAGFKVKIEDIPTLDQLLNKYASAKLSKENLNPKIKIDALLSFKSITPKLWEELKLLEPFGIGNPKPIFLTKRVNVKSKKITDKFVKLVLSEQEKNINAIYWISNFENDFERFFNLSENDIIDVVYELDFRVWNDLGSFQLNIKDFRKSQ